MITLELVRRIWQIIELPQDTEKVEARQVDLVTVPNGHPLLTIDAQHQRHLLIPIDWASKAIEDKQSSGIHILINEWGEQELKSRYIDVVCLKPYLNDLFDMIVTEILVAVDTTSDNLNKICLGILTRWRDLLSREPSKLPDKTVLIGAFGELSVLELIVRINQTALNVWTGPNGGRYDFFTGAIALEVKSSVQRKGRIITIHGHDQLERPDGGSLYLSCLKLEETPSGGTAISDLVNVLLSLGCDRIKLLTKLADIGLSVNVIAQCDDIRFMIVERRTYIVDEYFPRITLDSFKNNAFPNRIIALSYQVDLSSEPPHPLQESQEQELILRIASEAL